jgi:hypothetical protein
LHIAVQKYIEMNQDRRDRLGSNNLDQEQILLAEEEEQVIFTDLKHIMKELLFNGARRDIMGNFELATPKIMDTSTNNARNS